jgi:hypothetical protein
LFATVTLYPAEAGGKTVPIASGYRCPCMMSKAEPGWDAILVLEDGLLAPGQVGRAGFVFLSEEAACAARIKGRFFLWEGRFIGEAEVLAADPGGFTPLER